MRKRNIRIQVRLNDIEYEKLLTDIDKSDNNISDYIRKLIIGKEIKEKPDHDFLKILNELSRIGVNINQIAHNVNGLGEFDKNRYEQEADSLFTIVKRLKEKYLWKEKFAIGNNKNMKNCKKIRSCSRLC